MGPILSLCPTRKCLPTRYWWKGERAEGPEYWRYVIIFWVRDVGFYTSADTRKLIEGELIDLIEDFSEGRVQFAFVKVKDPNTTLPKYVMIGWVSSKDQRGT